MRRPDQHQAGGVEPVREEAGAVQIRPSEAPQHRSAPEPGEDAGGKTGRSGAIFFVAAGAEDFVHGADRKPAIRQGLVDRGRPERQYAMPRRPFELPDARAKRAD